MKKYESPICEQFLVEEELLQSVSTTVITPGADDLGGNDVIPPGPGIGDDPVDDPNDFAKGGMVFE
jgi:hypothetical protein